MKKLKHITFCTTCMNRTEDLKQTYLKSIKTAITVDKNTKFVLLNYNSTDDLDTWVKKNLTTYIQNNILKYIKTNKPKIFHPSHAKNVAHLNSETDIICYLDADNVLTSEYVNLVLHYFNNNDTMVLQGGEQWSYGRICSLREVFIMLGGYDEQMTGWGSEDSDYILRAKNFLPGGKDGKVCEITTDRSAMLKYGTNGECFGPHEDSIVWENGIRPKLNGGNGSSFSFSNIKNNLKLSQHNFKNKNYIANMNTKWGVI